MHDIHIHSNLSSCAREEATFENYLQKFASLPLTVIGFADHLWDKAVPGASPWYAPQDLDHVLPLKEVIRSKPLQSMKILFGCEIEYIGNGVCSLHEDHSELFDFVLVPANHFHMKGFVRPAHIERGKELTKLYIDRFLEVCNISFADGIVHPFVPAGSPGMEKEILESFEDHLMEECFKAAYENNKSVELNLSGIHKMNELGILDEYARIMQIARECKCRFHLGSDAHSPDVLSEDFYALGYAFAEKCQIVLPEDPFVSFAG